MSTTGIHPDNQVPELKDYNLYTRDPALRAAVVRGGAGWRDDELVRQGAEYGAEATLRAAEDANRHEPELHTHSRIGERIDQVQFHPAWHTMMAIARRNGIANLPFFDERPSAWTARTSPRRTPACGMRSRCRRPNSNARRAASRIGWCSPPKPA